MKKTYLDAQTLLNDGFQLGLDVLNSGFKPDLIVGIWRGGTPVAIAAQEIMAYHGALADHCAIRTASYQGIGVRDKSVQVHGLEYVIDKCVNGYALLLVDDVFDTGLSLKAVIESIYRQLPESITLTIRIAAPWFKPANNQTSMIPDYYLHETDQWLVFPHELVGLSREEIIENKPGLGKLLAGC